MNPVRFSLKYPQVVYTIAAMILAMGIQALLKMPRREDPKVAFPGALVIAAYPGATAEQVESQLTKSHQGSGLGLAIARSLAELHGGTIRIRSTPTRGTVVLLRLPVLASPLDFDETAAAA